MKFEGKACRLAPIAGLEVRCAMLGSDHAFSVNGIQCAIRLPSIDWKNSCAYHSGLKDAARDDPANWYGISQVEVCTALPTEVEYLGEDECFTNHPSVMFSPWHNKAMVEIPVLLGDVMSRWIRTIRWHSRSSLVEANDDGAKLDWARGDFRVYRSSDNKLFLNHGGVARFKASTKLEQTDWNQVGNKLKADNEPPVWYDLISAAEARLREGSLQEAIVSAAMSCETVIRAVFWSHIPNVTNATAMNAIDNVAVQGLLGRWADLTGITKQEADDIKKSEMHTLFDIRNEIVHRGGGKRLANADAPALIHATRTFVQAADEILNRDTGASPVGTLAL